MKALTGPNGITLKRIICGVIIMSVINVKVNDIRPKYNNLEKWMSDNNNIYIGRKNVVFINGKRFPSESSIWSNPYKIGKDGTREEVVKKYETYMKDKLNKDKQLVNQLKELKGKTLGCWCKPDLCHGDILLKLIDEYK